MAFFAFAAVVFDEDIGWAKEIEPCHSHGMAFAAFSAYGGELNTLFLFFLSVVGKAGWQIRLSGQISDRTALKTDRAVDQVFVVVIDDDNQPEIYQASRLPTPPFLCLCLREQS